MDRVSSAYYYNQLPRAAGNVASNGFVSSARFDVESLDLQQLADSRSQQKSDPSQSTLGFGSFLTDRPSYLCLMLKRPNQPDVITLTGDPIERAQQVLDAARDQLRMGQQQTDSYRVEEALSEAEEAVDRARAHVTDAVEANLEAEEESGAAERKRAAWRPASRPV